MLELNSKFTEPLKEYRVIMDTKSAEKAVEKYLLDKDKWYNYSNKRLIEILNISKEEQRELKTIISNDESNRREKIAKKLKSRNDEGLTIREQRKKDKVKKILELKDEGLKSVEIGERLGISKRYVNKILGGN